MVNEHASQEASDIRAATLRLARRIRQQRSIATMSDGQFAVLVNVYLHGPHTLSALAERDGVTAPSMNRTVNCLEELGYVTRASDDEDRRKVRIAITEQGSAVVDDTVQRRDGWLQGVLDTLEPDDRATLHAAAQIILREVHR
ncbi:MarR family winged helix-turn-helix transcriptional regulator [Microbacterium amylolyticum]|uniref:DNA-binding MarR family transcriptional regulator n=1 Tax=Microbacterium amylolyticum TaxID=936337 RepID=A0ABS4ZH77_9MICO|nr:MarR family transcriptional regulator [Microbacterium amylolyticum]MBP2436634.1 DNA-binding MarR family transcriptional regulator [Microbacterium amylolyticum]